MVSNLHLEFDYEGEGGCGNGAIVNVYNNDDEHFLAPFDENSLVSFT